MTGFGAARRQEDSATVGVEIRSVNNRYFKCSIRLPELLAAREPDAERLIRGAVARGTVSLSVRVDETHDGGPSEINKTLLRDLARQAGEVADSLNLPRPGLEGLIAVPGVVLDRVTSKGEVDRLWPIVEGVLGEALKKFEEFRRAEGSAMSAELSENLAIIEQNVEAISETAPAIVAEYRDRLLERVGELLAETSARVDQNDLIREVSLFADRSDINEEITRLRSHIEQFRLFLNDQSSQGRRLDFLTQELNREVNTIGSKANNVVVAHRVVDMKAAVEKIREILQNIE